jgi:N-acyl amino acid synthase FeeM
MSPLDLSTALLYGVPIALSASMCAGFDSLLARRSRTVETLPRSLAKRSNLRLLEPDSSGLHLVVAKSREQLVAAAELVRQRYALRGYQLPDTRTIVEQARKRSAQEVTFLAASEEAPVGTLTLGLDGPAGLLAEGAYGNVVAKHRARGNRVIELTRLALAQGIDSKTILAALFCLAHAVARTHADASYVFIEVNPRHVSFYSRVLGFVVAAGEKFCERVRAPSILLGLEMQKLEERLMALDVAAAMRPMAKAA